MTLNCGTRHVYWFLQSYRIVSGHPVFFSISQIAWVVCCVCGSAVSTRNILKLHKAQSSTFRMVTRLKFNGNNRSTSLNISLLMRSTFLLKEIYSNHVFEKRKNLVSSWICSNASKNDGYLQLPSLLLSSSSQPCRYGSGVRQWHKTLRTLIDIIGCAQENAQRKLRENKLREKKSKKHVPKQWQNSWAHTARSSWTANKIIMKQKKKECNERTCCSSRQCSFICYSLRTQSDAVSLKNRQIFLLFELVRMRNKNSFVRIDRSTYVTRYVSSNILKMTASTFIRLQTATT